MRFIPESRLTTQFAANPQRQGFVPYPTGLLGGLSPEQVAWQQQVYRRAYAAARATVGYRVFVAPAFGQEARN